MSLYQFLCCSALRLLQRWIFQQAVPGVCSHEPLSFLCSLPLATAASFTRLSLGVCSHEPLSVLCSLLCACLQLVLSPGCSWVSALMRHLSFLSVSALRLLASFTGFHSGVCSHEHVSVLSVLCFACYALVLSPGCPRCLLSCMCQFLSVFCSALATALDLSLGCSRSVCSHEHVSVLSVLCCCASYIAGSFTRLPLGVCSHELCQFSLFSALLPTALVLFN
jgi:hypothetical protein